MSDTPERRAQMRKTFEELRRISEEAGFYDLEEPSPEEIVEAVKEVRLERAVYRLQSEAWAQGAEWEQNRILKIIKQFKYKPGFTYEVFEHMIISKDKGNNFDL